MLGAVFRKKTDERTLLSQIERGDEAAMHMLYERYVRYLSAVVSRYIPNDEDVKDVLQEVFLNIFSALPSFSYRGEGSLKGWMASIALHEALGFLKKEGRVETTEMDEQLLNLSDDEPATEHVPIDTIHLFIRSLPDGYRAVFNLYVIENKSHKEIASLLGISEGTSASQLHKAKALLAAKISQYQRTNTL